MKILSLNNKHVKKDENDFGYGCICRNCGTVFIFDSKDICRPRTPYPDLRDCKVPCPNTDCRVLLSMDDDCIHKFKNSDETKHQRKRIIIKKDVSSVDYSKQKIH